MIVGGSGRAFVYDLDGAAPIAPVSVLNNPSPAAPDAFGSSVAISGAKVVVGACGDDTGANAAGSAYVYDLASGTPTLPVVVLNNLSARQGDAFSASVVISGTRIVVSAPSDDTKAKNAGSAYVYDMAVERRLTDGPTVVPFTLVRASTDPNEVRPDKGRFTSFIEAPLPATIEGTEVRFDGDGHVLITVGKAKSRRPLRAKIVGRMPDGEPFSAGSVFTIAGKFPIRSKAYKRGKKSLGSVVAEFAYEAQPDANFAEDGFVADVLWQKQANTSATYYPGAIDTKIVTQSLRYYANAATRLPFFNPPVPAAGEGTPIEVTISGGDLPSPITRDIIYRPGKPLVVPDNGDLKLKLHVDPQAGTLDGNFVHPGAITGNKTKTRFYGVFELMANEGRAVFQGQQHSGQVVVRMK